MGKVRHEHEHDGVQENAEVAGLSGGVGGFQAEGGEHGVRQLVDGRRRDDDEEDGGQESVGPGERHFLRERRVHSTEKKFEKTIISEDRHKFLSYEKVMSTVVELKEVLRGLGLKVTGTKAELMNRLSRAKAGALSSGNKGRRVPEKKSSPKVAVPPHRRESPSKSATVQRVMPKGVPALKEYAKSHGLKTTGTTTDLEQRIRRYWAGATRQENKPGAKAAPAPARRVRTPSSPVLTAIEAAKVIDEIKKLVVEYKRLPEWSSRAITPDNIEKRRVIEDGGVVVGSRGIATKNDLSKVDLLREIYERIQSLPSSPGNSPGSKGVEAFVRSAENEFKKEVERAPRELRLLLQRFHIEEMTLEEFAKMGR